MGISAMGWARGLVLLLAIGSAIGAALIVRQHMAGARARIEKPPVPIIELLVLRRAIAAGEAVRETDLRWQPWPAPALPGGAIHRRHGAPARPFIPALARYPLLEGEPLAEAKLLRPGDGSVIAALISPGKRAVAIPVREDSAAGGLIQPSDRVDLLWTQQKGDRLRTGPATRTILRGVKVRAIGKSIEARGKGADGRTATLELTPKQARIVATARAVGDISLALIPVGDAAALASRDLGDDWDNGPAGSVQLMKFGRQSAAPLGTVGNQ
jgi:pilus assembly protein CpaB